ncbi:MAG: PPE domain-containing protein [Mycobacteriaceae bacterium]
MVGFTGVIWLPRGAAKLSLDLATGVGSVDLNDAGTAWAAMAAVLSESALTLEKTNLQLRLGFEGEAAEAAYKKIEPFAGWVGGTAALAALCAGKAEVQAGAYNVAVLAMPNIVEVEAIQTAKASALATGGLLTGASAAVEAVEQAEDMRAALVMEAYEAASSVLALPINFPREPVMVRDDSVVAESTAKHTITEDATVGAGQTAAAASIGGVDIPAALSAAPGLASAGFSSASSVVSSGSAALGSVIPASTSAAGVSATAAMGGFGAPMAAGALGQQNESTRSAAANYRGIGNSTAGLSVSSPGLTPGLAAFSSDGTNTSSGSGHSETTSGVRNVATGSPIIGGRPIRNTEETRTERVSPSQQFEHFADGRVVTPAVIGALDPDEE